MAAPIQQWADFMALVDLDAERTDELGQQARMAKTALSKYMKFRFDEDDPIWLANIIMSPDVVAAVTTSLTHIAEDDAAVKAAVDAAVGAA